MPLSASGEIRTLCPNCSASRRKSSDKCLSVNASQGLWHCHHCHWSGRLWRPGYGLGPPPRRSLPAPVPRAQTPPDDVERRRAQLRAVWREARPITPDDAAGLYLKRRGLWQTPVPRVLRLHPHLPYYDAEQGNRPTHHPAMVAAIQSPSGQVISIHRTYLTDDGHKANVSTVKKFMQPTGSLKGAAIRLDTAGSELLTAEGIETAMAVRLTAAMRTWCGLSATGLENLWVPESVRLVVIAGDNDAHGKGQTSARKLAARLLHAGHKVKILLPLAHGDWADPADNSEEI